MNKFTNPTIHAGYFALASMASPEANLLHTVMKVTRYKSKAVIHCFL